MCLSCVSVRARTFVGCVYVCVKVYSESYNVPVMYVRGRSAGGAVLSTQTVWKDLCAPHSLPATLSGEGGGGGVGVTGFKTR